MPLSREVHLLTRTRNMLAVLVTFSLFVFVRSLVSGTVPLYRTMYGVAALLVCIGFVMIHRELQKARRAAG